MAPEKGKSALEEILAKSAKNITRSATTGSGYAMTARPQTESPASHVQAKIQVQAQAQPEKKIETKPEIQRQAQPAPISRKIASAGSSLHRTWEKVQTGVAFASKKSDKQFLEQKMAERYQIFQKVSGDRHAAKRVDYR